MSPTKNKPRDAGDDQTVKTSMKCSTCGEPFVLEDSDAPPFCSQRCQMIDLGRWLDEEIAMPHEGGPAPGDSIDLESVAPEQP